MEGTDSGIRVGFLQGGERKVEYNTENCQQVAHCTNNFAFDTLLSLVMTFEGGTSGLGTKTISTDI